MKILKLLNKKFLIFLFLTLISSHSNPTSQLIYGIWKILKKMITKNRN